MFHHEAQLEVTEEAVTRDQGDLTQLPCPGEQLQIDDTYTFIADDVLNNRPKDGHFGLLISKTMQTISVLTEGFTSTNKLISLTRETCNEITQNTGQTCLDIMTKFDEGKHLSHREMHFLSTNRGHYYSAVSQHANDDSRSQLKAVSHEIIQQDNMVEIQKFRTINDCFYCGTSHPMQCSSSCSTRLLNCPTSPDIAVQGGKTSMIVGILSLLSLPWIVVDHCANLGMYNEVWHSVHLDDMHGEADPTLSCYGRALGKRLALFSTEEVPVLCEFQFEKMRVFPHCSFLKTALSFLRIIRTYQKNYGKPILTMMSWPVFQKTHGANDIRFLKLQYEKHTAVFEILASLLGVPFIDFIVLRKISIGSHTFEWMKSAFWQNEAVYNRNMQPTLELQRRIANSLHYCLAFFDEGSIPEYVFEISDEELGENWE